jgi:hypothetical protein
MARQVIEACGWEWTPKYIVRVRESVYGEIFPAASRYGHSRPTNCTPVAMAEWPYGTYSLYTNSRRITPSLCSDLSSERDSQLRALFGNVTKPFADIPVDELIGGLQ